jgi:hypothetical protein
MSMWQSLMSLSLSDMSPTEGLAFFYFLFIIIILLTFWWY